MTLEIIEEMLREGSLEAVNTAYTRDGEIQVSIRRRSANGWEIYYGVELSETMLRAARGGVQRILPVVDAYQMEIWR